MAVALLLAMAIALMSCSPNASPPMGAVVRIDSEASIAADTTSLVIRVYGSPGQLATGGDVLREERTVALGTNFHLPYTVGITPLGGDVTRLYRIEVDARDVGGGLIATAKAISGFTSGRLLLLDLVFTDACRGVVCADTGSTCKAAACVDASVDPTTLTTFTPDAGPS